MKLVLAESSSLEAGDVVQDDQVADELLFAPADEGVM